MQDAEHSLTEQLEAEVRRANEAMVAMKIAIAESEDAQRRVNALRKEVVTLTRLLAQSEQEREALLVQLQGPEHGRL